MLTKGCKWRISPESVATNVPRTWSDDLRAMADVGQHNSRMRLPQNITRSMRNAFKEPATKCHYILGKTKKKTVVDLFDAWLLIFLLLIHCLTLPSTLSMLLSRCQSVLTASSDKEAARGKNPTEPEKEIPTEEMDDRGRRPVSACTASAECSKADDSEENMRPHPLQARHSRHSGCYRATSIFG